jgi:hypothetical protein
VTTLLLDRSDYTDVSAAANGGLRVELTEAGARRLVELADRHRAALTAREKQRVKLATSTFGGPPPDVAAEATRRTREITARIQPVLGMLRSASVVDR